MSSFRQVLSALGQHGPLGVYDALPHVGDVRWPYPPAYFPWVYASGVLASHGGPSLEFTIRLAPIAANLGIAFVVQDFLGQRGAERSTRLAGAALVAPGPSFLVVSGYHGQFDAVAFLPAVLALTLWERDLPRRALWAGLLIGLGGALKTVPLLLLVALLPSVRTRREAAVLVGAAALPVLAALAPFAIAGTLPDLHVFTYRGIPGAGGLSLVADPRIVEIYMGQGAPALGPAFTFLVQHGGIIAGLALAAMAAVGLRTRGHGAAPGRAVARDVRVRRELLLSVPHLGAALLPHGGPPSRGPRGPALPPRTEHHPLRAAVGEPRDRRDLRGGDDRRVAWVGGRVCAPGEGSAHATRAARRLRRRRAGARRVARRRAGRAPRRCGRS